MFYQFYRLLSVFANAATSECYRLTYRLLILGKLRVPGLCSGVRLWNGIGLYGCMVHANNSVTNVSVMAGNEECNLTSLVLGELRKLGVKAPKLKKSRTRTNQQSGWRSGGREHGGIFGVPIEDQDMVVSEETGIPVPWFLKLTTHFLLENKCSDGLFRKTGSISRQRELRRTLENGGNLKGAQVHDVAAILKQWFRELPETVVPKSLNELIIRCMHLQSTELHVQAFQLVCLLLPPEHLHVLQHTLLFLSVVAEESGANRMDAHNLAVVMAPNLLTSRCEAMPPKKARALLKMCEQLQSQTLFVELMIANAAQVGQLPAALKRDMPVNPSDDELEQSGDELSSGQGQPKTRKQGVLVAKLRRMVPRSRDTPTELHGNTPLHRTPRAIRVQRASTLDLVTMECSPRLPMATSRARSPLTTTERLPLSSAYVTRTEGLRRSKRSVTSVVSFNPLTAESPGRQQARTAPVRRHSTRSLKNIPAQVAETEVAGRSIQPGTSTERGARYTRRSLSFYAGCRAVETVATPVHRVPTPGTVKSRSTLKRGRPNTVYTGLPSPFKPPDSLTPQVSRKASRSIKFNNHAVEKGLSGSTFSLADVDALEEEVFGRNTNTDPAGGADAKKSEMNPECDTNGQEVNLIRQSSYTAVYEAIVPGERADKVDNIHGHVNDFDSKSVPACVDNAGGQKDLVGPVADETAISQVATLSAPGSSESLKGDAVCLLSVVSALPGLPSCDQEKADEVDRRTSLESSFSVSRLRIADGTPTAPKQTDREHSKTVVNQEKDGKCLHDLQSLVSSERWATPLPISVDNEDDSGCRRESIVQIRKRNAGIVRQNVRLFSQHCDSAVFVTPKRPPVRKAASVNAGPTFVRNAQGTRSLRTNTSGSGLSRVQAQRSPLQQANRMDIGKNASVSRKPSIKACSGTKEWVMEV